MSWEHYGMENTSFPFNFDCCDENGENCRTVGVSMTLPEKPFRFLDRDYRRNEEGKIEYFYDGKIGWEYDEDALKEYLDHARDMIQVGNSCPVLKKKEDGEGWYADEKGHTKNIPMYYSDSGDPSVGIFGRDSQFDLFVNIDHALSNAEEDELKKAARKFGMMMQDEVTVEVDLLETFEKRWEAWRKQEEEMEKMWREEEKQQKLMEKQMEEEMTEEDWDKLLEGADEAYEYWRDRQMEKVRRKSRF